MSITSGLAPIRNYANGGDINTKRQNMLAKLGFPSGMTNEDLDAAIAEEERISSIASGGNAPKTADDLKQDVKDYVFDYTDPLEYATLPFLAPKFAMRGKKIFDAVRGSGSSLSQNLRGIGAYIGADVLARDVLGYENPFGDDALDQANEDLKKVNEKEEQKVADAEDKDDSSEEEEEKGIGALEDQLAFFQGMMDPGEMTGGNIIASSGIDTPEIRRYAKGGIAALAEGGEVEDDKDEGGIKLLGKDGILFDYTNPTDYALLIPGLGLIGLGARAVTKAPAIIKTANAAFKSAGKAAKKKGFNVRDPKTGKILSDVDAGKATVIGSTTTGKVLRGSAAVGVGGKLLPEGEEKVETKKEEEIITEPLPPEDTRTFFEKLKDAPGNLFKELQDDPEFRARFLAGSMNMMRPVEGFVPVSGVTQFYDAFEDKRQEQLASKLAAAKIAAANKGDSIFENILAGTDEIGSIAVLPTNVKLSLFAGAEDLVATPQGAQIMGVEAGSPVDDSMMITLIQQLQSAGYYGTNLENAIKATIQPAPVPE